MADPVVVDTDLLVDFLRGRGEGARLVRSLLQDGRLRPTAISGFEILVGADFLDRREDILQLFRSRTVSLDLASSLRAGEVFASLRARGRGISFADCLQAGICLHHRLPLATRNRRHFERIDGLSLVTVG